MKIVLIKPFIPQNQRTILTLPIGLLYLASYLKKNIPEIKIKILDPDIFLGTFEEFVKSIILEKPDIIGVSVFSHTINETNKIIAALKDRLQNVKILMGGSHLNAVRSNALMQMPLADYGFYGEGEKGLLQFYTQSLIGDISLKDIRGLIYKEGSKILVNANEYTKELDEFDPIDYSLIDIKTYFQHGSPMGIFRKGNNVAQIITTRGCPFNCTFCASPVNMGKKVRKRSTQNIISEIETLVSLGADEIHIMDDNFTFNRDHVIDLCKEIVDRKIKIHISMPNGVRLDRLDMEMVSWMKSAGWYHLGFGIEVGSDQSLKIIKKGIVMALIKEKILMVKKAGLTTAGFFILGFPHDTLKSLNETINVPDKLGLDMASFGNFTPLPGTELFDDLVKKGEISPDYLPSFAFGKATYAPKGISFEQLSKIQNNAVLKYYIHPKRIMLILSRLKLRDIVFVFRRLYHLFLRPAINT